MLSPEIRRRLSQLNRERRETPATREVPDEARTPVPLERLVEGRVHTCGLGEFLLLERQVGDVLRGEEDRILRGLQALNDLGICPEEALFLDIETCGLTSSPVFLVGALRYTDGVPVMEQIFARDYSEEAALLDYCRELIQQRNALVTFNGKTFDIPYLKDRMVLHRLAMKQPSKHLDLLPECRRRWRGVFPDCRLQTLEERLCGRRRFGDTPGHLIPGLYHTFVKTGNAAPIRGILHHNALDLLTMVDLLPHLR